MKSIVEFTRSAAQRDGGQDMIEYALILGFISGVMLLTLTAAGQSITAIWGALIAALNIAIAGL